MFNIQTNRHFLNCDAYDEKEKFQAIYIQNK